MGRTACTEPHYLYKGALYLYLYVIYSIPYVILHMVVISPSMDIVMTLVWVGMPGGAFRESVLWRCGR